MGEVGWGRRERRGGRGGMQDLDPRLRGDFGLPTRRPPPAFPGSPGGAIASAASTLSPRQPRPTSPLRRAAATFVIFPPAAASKPESPYPTEPAAAAAGTRPGPGSAAGNPPGSESSGREAAATAAVAAAAAAAAGGMGEELPAAEPVAFRHAVPPHNVRTGGGRPPASPPRAEADTGPNGPAAAKAARSVGAVRP